MYELDWIVGLARGSDEMTKVSDVQRIQHLKATVSESERSAIDHAVTLWQATHGAMNPINPSTRGEVLAAICAEWVAMTVDRLKGD